MARLARFYSMDPMRVMELDSETMWELVDAIPVLTAREQLDRLVVVDYPYMKPEKRNRVVSALKREANPSIIEEQAVEMTPDQMMALINGG